MPKLTKTKLNKVISQNKVTVDRVTQTIYEIGSYNYFMTRAIEDLTLNGDVNSAFKMLQLALCHESEKDKR